MLTRKGVSTLLVCTYTFLSLTFICISQITSMLGTLEDMKVLLGIYPHIYQPFSCSSEESSVVRSSLPTTSEVEKISTLGRIIQQYIDILLIRMPI